MLSLGKKHFTGKRFHWVMLTPRPRGRLCIAQKRGLRWHDRGFQTNVTEWPRDSDTCAGTAPPAVPFSSPATPSALRASELMDRASGLDNDLESQD